MSHRKIIGSLLLAGVACGLLAVANANPKLPMSLLPKPPAGYLLVDEEMWSELIDEAGRHLDRARELFLQGHTRMAAFELRKAAIMMRIDAAHGEDALDRQLIRAAEELDRTVAGIRNGQSTATIEDIDAVSSQALAVLARHEQTRSAMAWTQHHPHRSGRYLHAAADNLERSAVRARIELSTSTTQAIRNARNLSARLIEGTGSAIEEVGRGIDVLGHQIEKFEQSILHPHFQKP